MKVKQHIYDDNGLVRIEEIEVDETPIEEQIKSKEEQLLQIYNELQKLKEQQ
jgi:hypothetical protein